MTRHWTVSIGAPVHLDLAQYAAAIERAKQEGKPARAMIEANPGKTSEDRDMSEMLGPASGRLVLPAQPVGEDAHHP
jgi:hypothetical protein